ncbi:glycosyltransferase family 39 protein [bacterium]|nr:glycosyltransferase family 39 protein [bacterium]
MEGAAGGAADAATRRWDPCLLGILALAAALDIWHLQWGLPNGDHSWAADAIGPITALGVARRTFASWNSGWFYFKYPPGWPFILVAASLPYLGVLYATGGWRHPTAEYPYGFADPEHALFVLSMIGRLVAVACGVGITALAYGIAARLFDRSTARWSAFLTATSYPLVFYAHTTNLDISYCFWLVLALYAAIRAAASDGWRAAALLGIAAAMALSTKEQGFAWLLPLPVLVWTLRVRAAGWRALGGSATWAMLGAGAATLLVANNAIVNPMGFVGRIAYLLGHPIGATQARLAPVEFALWKGAKEWVYLDHLRLGMDCSLGMPLLLLAGCGMLLLWRHRLAAAWLLLPVVLQYYLSLRGLELITVRYLLPITVVAGILAAVTLARLQALARARWERVAATVVASAFALLSLARAVELDLLLRNDARYAAEAWMASHLPTGATAEVYQKPAFVPRFRHGLHGRFVPMDERTIAGLAARNPDAIVTSSASHKSIDHVWTADWRETRSLLAPHPAASELLAALEQERLPYRLAAVFNQQPRLVHNRITSIAPEIRIYVRRE